MGSNFSISRNTIQTVWSCTDLIHEFMDWVELKDISSISRIHRASSCAIFTYHFKEYHPCNYFSFISWVEQYDWERVLVCSTKRPNCKDKLIALNFHSLAINSVLAQHFYLWPCVAKCSALTIYNIKILEDMLCLYLQTGINFMANSITITESSRGLITRKLGDTEHAFIYVRELKSMTINDGIEFIRNLPLCKLTIRYFDYPETINCLSGTLESLTIEYISNDVDLSNLISLKELIVRGAHCSIIIPNNVERLELASINQIDRKYLPKNLTWFSTGYKKHSIIDSIISPSYFKDVNIKELCLWGFPLSWWKKFDPPSNLEVLACQYDMPTICRRIKMLPNCSLTKIILAVFKDNNTIRNFISGHANTHAFAWFCSEKANPGGKLPYNVNTLQWYKLTIDEFQSLGKISPTDWNYLNRLKKYKSI